MSRDADRELRTRSNPSRVDRGPVLVFDGDCGFCTRSAEFGRRHLGVDIVAWQRADLDALALTEAECEQAVQWVAGDGQVSSGAAAVAAALRTGRWWWRALGVTLSLPGVRWVAARVYSLVARNRYRLPGATDACQVPR